MTKNFDGGITYINPNYKGRETENGVVIDVNNIYGDAIEQMEQEELNIKEQENEQ